MPVKMTVWIETYNPDGLWQKGFFVILNKAKDLSLPGTLDSSRRSDQNDTGKKNRILQKPPEKRKV
jgi:hypothetical protein